MDAANTCTDADTLYQLLESTFGVGTWSLLDVCCMCASSKLLHSAWLQLLRQHPSPAWLVTAVADVASAKTPAIQSKATAVMKWLLDSLSEGGLAQHPGVPAGLLTIPNIPLQLAEQLCRYGVRVPYEQIVAAARWRVAGVEVWVLVQSALGITAGIPAAAKMVCNGVTPQEPNGVDDLTVGAMCDIVHLGINSANQAAAWAAAGLLSARLLSTTGGASLPPGQALDLLGTAVERHQDELPHPHRDPDSVLCSIVASLRDSNSLDAVSPAQLMPLLQHAVQLDAAVLHSAAPPEAYRRRTRIHALVEQPAFEQLTPEQLAALLEVAVEADDEHNCVMLTVHRPGHAWPMFKTTAYQQLDDATVLALMMLAVKAAVRPQRTDSDQHILRTLWTSDAGKRLREDGCQLLLPVLLAAISGWPAGTSSAGGVFREMILLEGDKIGSTVLLELLTAALQAGNPEAFEVLWWHAQPARSSFDGVDLGKLLRSASRCGKSMFMTIRRLLCEHKAWGAVGAEDKLAAKRLAAS